MTTSRLLLYGAGGQMWNEELDFDYKKYVIHRLMNDEVSLAVINDKLLVDFGKAQFEKLGIQRASDVRAKLRILGRIKLELRKIVCFDYIEQYLSAQLFDTCVSAVKHLGIVSKEKKSLSGTDLLEKPDLVLKAGQLLKKVTIMKRGKALRSNDSGMKEAADGFSELYLGEWADKFGGIARNSIAQRKYNRKIVLPMTEDVVKLSEGHLNGCQCIKEVAATCGLQKPHLITTTLLRKYTATVAQVLNLSESDVGELARHMGHKLAVHRKFYRLQEDVTELAKISKLLLLIDGGKVNKFHNKNLDDIEINDLFAEVQQAEKGTVEEVEEQMEIQTDEELEEQPDDSLVTSSSDTKEAAFSSDDSLRDPDFNPTDSADEADMKTMKKTKVVRTAWSQEELEAISRHMLPKLKISSKPPRRHEIIELQKKCPVLKARDWKSVGFVSETEKHANKLLIPSKKYFKDA